MWLLLAAIGVGCEEGDQAAVPATQPSPRSEVRVASLVPAVTNMLLELGQRDLLVAVSNYDTDERVAGLPRVGDLLTMDWEQLAAARPTHMVVQMSREKTPPGAIERADRLGIELVHVKIERLNDIGATIQQLGQTLMPSAGGRATGATGSQWRTRFEAALADAAALAPEEKLAVLVALAPDLSFVAGRNNYLDDLLSLAGAQNVIPADMPPWPNLDRELLASLRPRRVVLIVPSATEAQLAEARRAVESLAKQWGLTWEDVTVISDPYAMVPGWSVIEVLKRMAQQPAAH